MNETPEADIVREGFKAAAGRAELVPVLARPGRARRSDVNTFILEIEIVNISTAHKEETIRSYARIGTFILPDAAWTYYLSKVFARYALFDYRIAWVMAQFVESLSLLKHVVSKTGLAYTPVLFKGNLW